MPIGLLRPPTTRSILLEMDVEGDYPEVMWEYADRIASDGAAEEAVTIRGFYRGGLGCS
ncbi:MAG: hypothetical protein GY788_27295 [bacterium]|nr:hypothetical protein [bacterium]